jgi:hypothetical protein
MCPHKSNAHFIGYLSNESERTLNATRALLQRFSLFVATREIKRVKITLFSMKCMQHDIYFN